MGHTKLDCASLHRRYEMLAPVRGLEQKCL